MGVFLFVFNSLIFKQSLLSLRAHGMPMDLTDNCAAVSYTHLDVYKRQGRILSLRTHGVPMDHR